MQSPFAEHERERLIEAMLPDVAFDGWSPAAVRRPPRGAGFPEGEAIALFPRGAPEMIAAFSRWADRQMLERLATPPPEGGHGQPVARIALALRLRFELSLPWREAVRRGLSILAMPHNAPLGLRLLYETVDGCGTASATARPISASIRSARRSPGSRRRDALLARRPLAGIRRHARLHRPPPRRPAPPDRIARTCSPPPPTACPIRCTCCAHPAERRRPERAKPA